jgi:hypothetical protein
VVFKFVGYRGEMQFVIDKLASSFV